MQNLYELFAMSKQAILVGKVVYVDMMVWHAE